MVARYRGKNILVLGGTGFIGSRLAERLRLEEKAKVRVVVYHWKNAVWISRSDVELIQGDVNSKKTLIGALKNVDIVFDCIGIGGTKEQINRVNIHGLESLLKAIYKSKTKIKLVYLSSIAVFGPRPEKDADLKEDYVYFKDNEYAVSKIKAEKIIRKYGKEHKIPYVVIKPTYVWGPNSLHFTINPLLQIKNNKFYLINEGLGITNAVYIDNLIDAIILAGVKKQALNKSFTITDDVDYNWGQFFESYGRFLNKKIKTVYFDSAVKKISFFQIEFLIFKKLLKIINLAQNINSVLKNKFQYLFKINNYVLQRINKIFTDNLFIYNDWDLSKFTNYNKIDITRAKRLLNYRPKFNLAKGMAVTKKWLKIQNYI